jgi:hypothetical protein
MDVAVKCVILLCWSSNTIWLKQNVYVVMWFLTFPLLSIAEPQLGFEKTLASKAEAGRPRFAVFMSA